MLFYYQLHFVNDLKNSLGSRQDLVKWLTDLHNDVNKDNGKPVWSYSDVFNKYQDMYNNVQYPNINYNKDILSIYPIRDEALKDPPREFQKIYDRSNYDNLNIHNDKNKLLKRNEKHIDAYDYDNKNIEDTYKILNIFDKFERKYIEYKLYNNVHNLRIYLVSWRPNNPQ